jgi:hypothetical protein
MERVTLSVTICRLLRFVGVRAIDLPSCSLAGETFFRMALRSFQEAVTAVVKDTGMLRRIGTAFPTTRFRHRIVVDADPSGVGINTLFAASAEASHVVAVAASELGRTATRRFAAANNVAELVTCLKYQGTSKASLDVAVKRAVQAALVKLKPSSVRGPLVVTGSFVGLAALDSPALSHLRAVTRAAARTAGLVSSDGVNVRPSLTLHAQLAHLPSQYTQCMLALQLPLPESARSDQSEEVVKALYGPPPTVPRDGNLDNLLEMLDLGDSPRLIQEGITSQAWRVQVAAHELPPGFQKSAVTHRVDWLAALTGERSEVHEADDPFWTLAEVPISFNEPMFMAAGTQPGEQAWSTLTGRALVLWADVSARGMSDNEPITCGPVRITAEAFAKRRAAARWNAKTDSVHGDDYDAAVADLPIVAPPVVLFIADDVAHRLVVREIDAPAGDESRKAVRNTLRAQRRAVSVPSTPKKQVGAEGAAPALPQRARVLEGRLRVRVPKGPQGSLLIELADSRGLTIATYD